MSADRIESRSPIPDDWPPRPADEVFPAVMNVVDAAMFLRYDARPGMTTAKAARMIRAMVKTGGLPCIGRVGRTLLFHRDAILRWLDERVDCENMTDHAP